MESCWVWAMEVLVVGMRGSGAGGAILRIQRVCLLKTVDWSFILPFFVMYVFALALTCNYFCMSGLGWIQPILTQV